MSKAGGVAVVGADGSGTRMLARGNQVQAPIRWSPDGKRLVFTMWKGGTARLFVAGVDSRAERRRQPSSHEASRPTFGQLRYASGSTERVPGRPNASHLPFVNR